MYWFHGLIRTENKTAVYYIMCSCLYNPEAPPCIIVEAKEYYELKVQCLGIKLRVRKPINDSETTIWGG